MNNTEFVVKTDLSFMDYISVTNSIANEFFDEEGSYIPHVGRLNAMTLFYCKCVTDSKYDISHDINTITPSEAEILMEDEGFILAFNDAIRSDGMVRLDFANAYREAMDMVNTRKSSFASSIEILKGALIAFSEQIKPVLTENNLNALTKIADDISRGNLSADAIVEAYGSSLRG